eukprot:12143975-Karenia_brevis.AAC.1
MKGVAVCTADNSSTLSFKTFAINPHLRSAARFLHTQHPGHDVAPVGVVCMQKIYSEFNRIAASLTLSAMSRPRGTKTLQKYLGKN